MTEQVRVFHRCDPERFETVVFENGQWNIRADAEEVFDVKFCPWCGQNLGFTEKASNELCRFILLEDNQKYVLILPDATADKALHIAEQLQDFQRDNNQIFLIYEVNAIIVPADQVIALEQK